MLASITHLPVRAALASIGLLFLSTAYAWPVLSDDGLGRCLQTSGQPLLHCVLCYLAAASFLAALSPYPRLARSTSGRRS